jgi:hypothetical protein
MAISKVQQGFIGQQEVAKLLMIGSDGDLEVTVPMTDDEARDQEVHRRHHFGNSLAIQVKTSLELPRDKRRQVLKLTIDVGTDSVIPNPRFWFALAHLDYRAMSFTDPLFLVPSRELFELAPSTPIRQGIRFTFRASVEPEAKDMWSRFKVEAGMLGKRVRRILIDLEGKQSLADVEPALRRVPGMVWAAWR